LREELARHGGVHRNYLGGSGRGERNIALENIVKLEKVLSVSSRDLFVDSSLHLFGCFELPDFGKKCVANSFSFLCIFCGKFLPMNC
jgi:hypothetical protein